MAKPLNERAGAPEGKSGPPSDPIRDPRLAALLEIQALEHVPRTGWCQHGVPAPESVAAHGFGTAVLTLALGPEVDPPLDVDRATALALVHDLAEARLGDLPRSAAELLPAGVKRAAEGAALEDLLAPFAEREPGAGPGDGIAARAREALAGESREARFVHACDRLQLGLRLLGYLRAGQRGLETFRRTLAGAALEEFAPCEALRHELLASIERVLGAEGRGR